MDNSTNNMSEKLVQYLDGALSGSEKDGLEKQLMTDKNLQEELENLKLVKEAVRYYGLKKQVTGIHEQMIKETKTPVRQINNNRRIIRFSIAIAASVLLIFFATRLIGTGAPSPDKLFADNYHSYELSTMRGTETETVVEKAYKAKDYKRVIVLTDTSITAKNLFLSAMSYLEMKQPPEAVQKFKKVLQTDEVTGSNAFMDESEYYMGLAFILDKQYEFAAALLQKIKDNPAHLYHEKITDKLIKNVKKLK
jgi:tetratricopeptide (TPR) repeat protein